MGADITIYIEESSNTVVFVIAPSGELAKTVPTTTCEFLPEEAIAIASMLLNAGVAALQSKKVLEGK